MPNARAAIESFRQGAEFDGSIVPFVSSGHPDPSAIELLANALGEVDARHLREQAALALVELGLQTDPLWQHSVAILRQPAIAAALAGPGLRSLDPARTVCLEALKQSVPAELLRRHTAELVTNLKWWPGPDILLVIAKFKPPEAVPMLEALGRSPDWADDEALVVARAALGDEQEANRLIEAFKAATDPDQKALLAHRLGSVGTRAALEALAAGLRTDLVIEKKGAFQRSVRVDVLEALAYNFPDRAFLYPDNIQEDADYERAEKFCEATFHTRYATQRPPFLTIRGLPSGFR